MRSWALALQAKAHGRAGCRAHGRARTDVRFVGKRSLAQRNACTASTNNSCKRTLFAEQKGVQNNARKQPPFAEQRRFKNDSMLGRKKDAKSAMRVTSVLYAQKRHPTLWIPISLRLTESVTALFALGCDWARE